MNKLSVIFLFACCVLFASCQKDDSASTLTMKDKLVKTWTLTDAGYVIAGGVDVSENYPDLTFTFYSNGTYNTIVNGKSTEGTWRATDSSVSTIILDDLTVIRILSLTDKTLHIEFNSEGMLNARSQGVHTFEVLLDAK